jgi:hypothetical protein
LAAFISLLLLAHSCPYWLLAGAGSYCLRVRSASFSADVTFANRRLELVSQTENEIAFSIHHRLESASAIGFAHEIPRVLCSAKASGGHLAPRARP